MNENLYQLKESFLNEWPLRRIQNMTLEEYTNLNKTSFCYWIEAITTHVGSIWGGSAYKFGIFKRRNLESTTTKDNLITDGDYAWAKKYGATKEIAFQKVKTNIIAIIENTQNDTIENIDKIDLGDAYKWKIAFLYGDFNIINIFKEESLLEAAQSIGYTQDSNNFSVLNRFILSKKTDEQDYFDYTSELWKKTKLANSKQYWLYAPGENANKWEEFYNDGIMGLGWDELGDLEQYNSRNEIKNALVTAYGGEGDKKNDVSANDDFINKLNIGDIIIVKKGRSELLGFGEVISEYYFDDNEIDYKSRRNVDWKLKGNWKVNHSLVLKTLTDITKYKSEDPNYSKYFEMLLALMEGKVRHNNYEKAFKEWLKIRIPNDSGTKGSYIKAIELLNKKIEFNIYESNDISKLETLYYDLLKVQKIKNNKYRDENTPSYGERGFYSSSVNAYIDFHKQLNYNSMNSSTYKSPLNQILYGPPGTGKTYNSINKAIEIINPSFDLSQDREIVKDEFDRLVKLGQIVFTTFHQSMSYEDFIEGIKPKVEEDVNENRQVVYEIEDGIFKRLVENAKKVKTASKEIVENYSFDDAWNDLISEAENNLENTTPLFLSIQTPNLGLNVVEISERGNLKLKPIYSEEAKEYTVSYSRAKKLQEAFPNLSLVKNIDKEFRGVIGGSNSTAYWSILNFINQKINQNQKVLQQENIIPALPHVLIIDEINRGNVSQIFGELITLIEDSKRLGGIEALEVTLSYSKEKFGVPSNLYIIGTMNTADRSVEALDTALRRRFSFVEMMPDEKVIADKKFTDFDRTTIMNVINQRIEVLLDRNYTLGHSYFIKQDFKNSFQNEIIPLLQEYFYNDYGKIGLVLGKGFVREKAITAKNDKSIFADFDTKNEVDIIKSYELIPFTEIDFEAAIKTLLA